MARARKQNKCHKKKWRTLPHPPFCWEGGEPPTKFSKRVGLTGPQLLEGGCLERGDIFQGGEGHCNFYIKNTIKPYKLDIN